VTLATSIYALLLMVDGIDMLYRFEDSTQKWITAAIMVAGTIITGIIVGIVLGTIAAGVVLPFALA
jgi:cytochrome bd-type quinol oxidase subunit 2